MPPSAPYAAQHTQQPFPALYLYPLNDSFIPKHISLLAGQRVKIGRQTNPKTAPGEKNGFFDSKVLSRQHAEIWEDNSKIFIKDVKSSNGTFINGERLSPEGVESDPYELKSDDIVEFGIDIVGEDNKTIIHHKVAARAVCVFSEQDAQVAARAEQHQQQQQQQQHLLQQQQQHQQPYPHALMGAAQPGPNMPSQFNFVGGPQQRRPAPNVGQGIAGIGGMGGSMRPPGKSGLTFEHILSRLQGELQKSRETGSELHSLTGSMNDIHQVLGGNIPTNIPPYPSALPPVRPTRQSSPTQSQQEQHPAPSSTSPPQPEQPSQHHQQSPPSEHPPPSLTSPTSTVVISQLQSQLLDTQTLLTKQVDKVRALEEVVADQELMRKEVRDLRQLFDTRSREIMFEGDDEEGQHQRQQNGNGLLEPRGGFDDHDDDDDIQHIRMLDEGDDDEDVDDTRSVHTIVPHELESVEEEDEEDLAEAERDHHPRIDEVDYADDRADPIDPVREREDESGRHVDDQQEEDHEHHHQMRKHENLNVGRPRTPEPSFGLREQPSSSSEINGHTKSPSLSINSNGTSPAMINSPRTRSGTLLAPRSPSSSPLSQPSETMPPPSSINGIVYGDGNDKMLEQMLQLSAQMTAMAELAGNMEAQYVAAKDMIKVLEGKVEELEKMVKDEKEKEKEKEEPEVVVAEPELPVAEKCENEEEEEERKSLTSFFSEFKKSFEGQWNEVKEEWREERERLKRAREEWESKSKSLDVNLEKVSQLNVTTSNLVKDVQGQKNELMRLQERVVMKQQHQFNSGEVVRSGLVTPPSPRSQSSASAGEEEEDAASGSNSKGERRRRRKRSGSQRGQTTINVRRRNFDHDMVDDEEAALSDGATLASEGTGPLEKVLAFAKDETIASENRLRKSLVGSSLKNNRDYAALSRSMFTSDDDEEEEEEESRLRRRRNGTLQQQRDMLPTPASMVTSLSLVDEDEDEDEDAREDGGGGRVGERKKVGEEYHPPPVKVNIQTAGAVIVLAVAAAAVFWKVKSE